MKPNAQSNHWMMLLRRHDRLWRNRAIPLADRLRVCNRLHRTMNLVHLPWSRFKCPAAPRPPWVKRRHFLWDGSGR